MMNITRANNEVKGLNLVVEGYVETQAYINGLKREIKKDMELFDSVESLSSNEIEAILNAR